MQIRQYTPEKLLGSLNEVERKNAPKKLYLAGDKELFRAGTWISIVGSRKASDKGRKEAERFTSALVKHGFVVVSGLAEGIDTVAHETAIAGGGQTAAVLGTPLDQVYPAKNRQLQEQIIENYLAISQFPLGRPVQKKDFPMRNRTMALLTAATIIVEGGQKSGTLHQGWEALRLGRLLFITESTAKNPTISWPKEMIQYGAQVLPHQSLSFLFDNLPSRPYDATVAF